MPTKKATKTKPKKRPSRRVTTKKSVARVVKSVLNGQAEKKFYQTSGTATLASTLANTDFIDISPVLQQGTTQAARIGNKVKILRVDVRGQLHYELTSAAYNTQLALAKVLIGRVKDSTGLPTVSQAGTLMQNGASATSLGPSAISFYRPWNRDVFSIYKWKNGKLGAGSNTVSSAQGFNNDFKNVMPFHFTLKPNRVVVFNDSTSTCNDYTLLLAACTIEANNSSASVDIFSMAYEVIYTYIDL